MRRFGGFLLVAAHAWWRPWSPSRAGSRSSSAKPYTTWTAYQGGSHSSQYSALDQINKSNVSRLDVAWTYPVTGNIIFNPIVVDDVMYVQGSGTPSWRSMPRPAKRFWLTPIKGRSARAG